MIKIAYVLVMPTGTWKDELEEKRMDGVYLPEHKVIAIREGFKFRKTCRVLFHELVHAFIDWVVKDREQVNFYQYWWEVTSIVFSKRMYLNKIDSLEHYFKRHSHRKLLGDKDCDKYVCSRMKCIDRRMV
jgi:hypothetical protein